MIGKSKGILLATAAAALFLSGTVGARAEEKAGGDQVVWDGVNKTTAADCKAKGGKVVEAKKE